MWWFRRYHLDLARVEALEQDVLGLEVAVHDARLAEHHQGVQDLAQKEPLQVHAQPTELVLPDELVQVDVQQLKHQAEVLAVHKVVQHAHDVVLVLRVALRR
eukprot:9503289-Pyramimonas_sp.AAC.1